MSDFNSSNQGLWNQIVSLIPSSEYQEIINIIGKKELDYIQDLWREYSALEEIVFELQGNRSNFIFNQLNNDLIQKIQGKLSHNLVESVAGDIRDELLQERYKLEDKINHFHRILDYGVDNALANQAACSPRSLPSDNDTSSLKSGTNTRPGSGSSIKSQDSSGPPSPSPSPSSGPMKMKKRCLSCGDKLLTTESTIKVPGAVRIKITDPSIAFCASCQLVYHLEMTTTAHQYQSQSQSQSYSSLPKDDTSSISTTSSSVKKEKFRQIECVSNMLYNPDNSIENDKQNFKKINEAKIEFKKKLNSLSVQSKEKDQFNNDNLGKSNKSKLSKKLQEAKDNNFLIEF